MSTTSVGPQTPAAKAPTPLLEITDFDPGEILFVPGSQGSIELNISGDRQAFTMHLDELEADWGDGTPIEQRRRVHLWKAVVKGPGAGPPAAPTKDLPAVITLHLTIQGFRSQGPGLGARLTLMIGDAVYAQPFFLPGDATYRWDVDHPIGNLNELVNLGGKEQLEFVLVATVEALPGSSPFGGGLFTVDSIDGQLLPPPAPIDPNAQRVSPRERLKQARAAGKMGAGPT